MKNLEEFVQLFAEQFEDTDPEMIEAGTKYHDLDEWSSLIGLTLMAAIDESCEVAVTGDDIQHASTVEDLYNKVVSLAKE